MLLPVKWLKDYVEIDEDVRELADGLTLSGSHVESINPVDKGIEKVVVGRIEKIEAHENADKLVVCQVDIGGEVIQIVTAATNVFQGALVPVALVGAVLNEGFKIKKGKLRGVESYGMFCSLAEFGYGDSVIPAEFKDGIYILDGDYELGKDIRDVLDMHDYVLEIELTPNRPDCLSILGLARETAASLNKDLRLPEIKIGKEEGNIEDYIKEVSIESDKCNRYYTRIIKDVKVGLSPIWLQSYLMEVGIRPVNNIVDISNFVMLEYGQPLHAFDYDKIKGSKILVRDARPGEKLTTLDGVERELGPEDLVIADEEDAICIAGVMGGLDSEITGATKTVLLESANFNGKSIRLTSNKFALRSEASTRYEKTVDANICSDAANRFCQLVEELGVGTVVGSSLDVYKNKEEEVVINFRPEKANKHLGIDLDKATMLRYFQGLGLKTEDRGDSLLVTAPSFRKDLKEEVDLIEEVGRLYGFHNIVAEPLMGDLSRGEKPYFRQIEDKAKAVLSGLGLSEIMTYSFISPKAYDKLKIAQDDELRSYATLLNPLGQDYSVMRTTQVSNMLETLSRNYNRKVKKVFFYEIGNIFKPKELPVLTIPEEKRTLSLGAYGEVDYYGLKEVVDILLARLGIAGAEYIREDQNPSFHPGRTARIILDDRELGIIGEVHPDVLNNFNIKERAYIVQLDFDLIIERANLAISHRELPKHPAMVRDLALVLDEDVLVGEIEKVIRKNGKKLLESFELFDVYKGDQIPEGKKSVAYSITYRAQDRTLTDEEVNKVQEKLVAELEQVFDAELRS